MTEGEVWSAEVLAELRAARYTPPAWIRFLARSFARARETRAQRPREHRQTVLIGIVGVAAWASALAAGRPWLALAGALWWLLVALMLDWHLGMLEHPSGRRLDGLGLANLLSVARAAVVPALVVASPALLAALFIPAGIIDGIDGRVARARNEQSRLGLRLDGGVDGFVIGAAAIGAARTGLLPWWAAVLVLGRHTLQWLIAAVAFSARARAPVRDGFVSGKIPGLVLFAGLSLAAFHVPGAPALVLLGALGGITTLALTVGRSYRLTRETGSLDETAARGARLAFHQGATRREQLVVHQATFAVFGAGAGLAALRASSRRVRWRSFGSSRCWLRQSM